MKRLFFIMSMWMVTMHADTYLKKECIGETTRKKGVSFFKVPNLEHYVRLGRTFHATHKIGGRYLPEATEDYTVRTQDQVNDLAERLLTEKGGILEWYYIDVVKEPSLEVTRAMAEPLALMMRWGSTE